MAGPAIPRSVQGHFPPEAWRAAARLLEAGRVEDAAFFRLGLAGRYVARNGRATAGFLALDRSGKLLSATCACSPRLRDGQLCGHLAALVLSASAPSSRDGAVLLPGERFERSLWSRAAEGLFDSRETASEAAPGGGPEEARVASLGAFELRLVELTRTPEEAALNLGGARTRRQALEESRPYLVAKRLFESLGDDPSAAGIERDGARLYLAPREGKGPGSPRLLLTGAAIEAALAEEPRFFAERGFGGEATARQSLRLTVEPDGSLLLSPVFLVGAAAAAGAAEASEPASPAPAVVPREGGDGARYGNFLFLPGTGALLRMDEARRPFADRSGPSQAGFDFDETWRPSPAGVPLDRPTRVPPGEAAAFLSRHRTEVAAWPAELLPPELRGGGLADPAGAVLTVTSEEGGRFGLALEYLVGGRLVPFEPIARARRARSPLHPAAGRFLDPQDARFGWMDLLEPASLRGKGSGARLLLAPLEVSRLRSYLPVGHRLEAEAGVSASALERLESLSPDTPAPPPEESGLSLYDFQRSGYAWLWFLYRNGFGGLLCDDMGLGKTHQVMALLAAIRREAGPGRPPSVLVVAPASVLPHWEEKLRLCLPSLPAVVHQGAGRSASPARGGVLLTTYGTLRNDAEGLSAHTFDLFVLDEIQSIKNRATATHRALRELKARVALGLTGTPVENRVEELHALLDFVLPGYLPAEAAFRKGFVRPIEDGDEEARARLGRLVRPFVLRRRKEQVAVGLPEKIDDRRLCEMRPGQAEAYRGLLSGRGAPLRTALDGEGPVSYLHVFALLEKLKQLCDHPDLLLPPGSSPSGESSGKWELFVELLDEALGSGLKVVVFSQYLRMLDRIERHLEGLAVGFAGIRGATADRRAPVARFHDEAGCRVFVASTKAAGLGIDLTPASVVIHYDRWWNKAREDQATDRVHRIGQKRGVQVLTLVTKGTVEERIDRIIASKARLAADLVPEEDPRLFRRFSREELRALLAP